jgi:hypothetical protein
MVAALRQGDQALTARRRCRDRLAATLNGAAAGVASGYKIARGTLRRSTAPIRRRSQPVSHHRRGLRAAPRHRGAWRQYLRADHRLHRLDGTLNVYAWKNTSGTDPTLVASTGTETFDWIAIGT